MRGVLLFVAAGLFLGHVPAFAAGHAKSHPTEPGLTGSVFEVAGLKFTIPGKWISFPAENPVRVGQWKIPPARGQTGRGGELVVFYFGPGIGGTPKENIEGWIGTMLDGEGHPAAAEVTHHETAGLKISEVVVFGTRREEVPIPGIPPILKPDCGLMGAVVESPQGNIYWRFIGPGAWLTVNLPLFNKIVDSVKAPGK